MNWFFMFFLVFYGTSSLAVPYWSLKNISAAPLPLLKNKKSKKIIVAVIDTGIDQHHPQLKDHLWTNPGESGLDQNGKDKSNNGIDDDKNGYIDDVHGWNFSENSNHIDDYHGHGTHVAGIINALAPDCQLMVLKYYQDKSSAADSLVNTNKALQYVLNMRPDVINFSGGGFGSNLEEHKWISLLAKQGITLVAASGNESTDIDRLGFYPASYPSSNIIAVAALDKNNHLLRSSNYGQRTLTLAAPGENIESTLPLKGRGLMTGTSQATAFVSGSIAYLLSYSPIKIPAAQLKQILTESADAEDSNKLKRLNLRRAIQFLDLENNVHFSAKK